MSVVALPCTTNSFLFFFAFTSLIEIFIWGTIQSLSFIYLFLISLSDQVTHLDFVLYAPRKPVGVSDF